MPDRFDESLLASPLSDREPHLRGRLLVLIAAAAGVLFVSSMFWWLGSGEEDIGSAAPTTTTIAGTVGSTATTILPVVLEAYAPDPPLLYHPMVLPAGWDACRVLEDASRGDRFCDPSDEESWVQVSVKYPEEVRVDTAQPVGDDQGGIWLDQDEYNEVAYLRGLAYVVVSNRGTLDAGSLLTIATSIPLVGSFGDLYGQYELPLDLKAATDDELASLMSEIDGETTVVRRTGEAQVFTPRLSLYAFWGDGYVVPDFPPAIPKPRLFPAERPILIGESTERGRGFAIWDQGGYGWRLEGQMTADEAAILATKLIEAITHLPTQ